MEECIREVEKMILSHQAKPMPDRKDLDYTRVMVGRLAYANALSDVLTRLNKLAWESHTC